MLIGVTRGVFANKRKSQMKIRSICISLLVEKPAESEESFQ